MKKISPLFILFFLTAACAPLHIESGKPMTLGQIQSIEKGVATKKNIKDVFGNPRMTGRDEAGFETWTYIYIDAAVPLRGGEMEERFQRVTVTFDGSTVKSISYELSD